MRRMELRKAASAIVARDVDEGPEILVLERGASSRFLPGYVAFPGGSTEPGDVELAQRWFGRGEEDARACAVRELHEEVSLAVTDGALVEAGGRSLEELAPEADQLVEIAHWVAPEEVPVRFDARFFALRAPAGLGVVADGGETADAWWVSPRLLLDEWRGERRRLYWPTYFTVSALAACERVEDVLALRIQTREPLEHEVTDLPPSVFWQDR
jgi:8-oxo-dGTP pyrophosphatase MutT (NUDIX family)